ncbi:hypothetical protein NQ129_15425, partial [Priestia aryabhattai]|nr:hypothetical protein [Priestia aryabhattai]
GQGEDSCGKSGTGETPQERKRRGGSSTARGKRSLVRKLTAVRCKSFSVYIINLFGFFLAFFENISKYQM